MKIKVVLYPVGANFKNTKSMFFVIPSEARNLISLIFITLEIPRFARNDKYSRNWTFWRGFRREISLVSMVYSLREMTHGGYLCATNDKSLWDIT